MRLIFLLLFSLSSIFASNLLTFNIYERSDRVDIMLSFDAPYEGSIYQKKSANSISLTLNDLIYSEVIEKNINSSIIQELSINPSKNSTIVTLYSNSPISVVASKTVDGFGLRIRSRLMAQKTYSSPANKPATNVQTPKVNNTISLQDSFIDSRYITVIGILFILVIFMLWLKSKVTKANKNANKVPANWLFKNAAANDMMKVLYEKPLDNNNKVVLFDFQGKQYLVMTGNSNVLLDKIGEAIKDENDFQNVFEENRKKLDEYLKIQQNPLEDYKEKASQDFYPQSS